MKILNILALAFGSFVKGSLLPVYTKDNGVGGPYYPTEASSSCEGQWEFTDGDRDGGVGSTMSAPAFAIITGEALEAPEFPEFRCNKYYKLTNGEGVSGFVFVSAYDEARSPQLSVSDEVCANLCGAGHDCTEGTGVTCELSAEEVSATPVYTSVKTAVPEEASTACEGEEIDWTSERGGSENYAILVNEFTKEEIPLNNRCLETYEIVGDVEEAKALVIVAAYEEETSTVLSISLQVCNFLCVEECVSGHNAPCAIDMTHIPTTTTTTTSTTTTTTTTEEATPADGEVEVFLWNGSCEEVTCGVVDWQYQPICGFREFPCFAKVEGTITLVDETEDSETNGQEIEVGCGHVLTIEGRFFHVVSVDEEKPSNALYIADDTFLGLCPVVCKDSGSCALTEAFCGVEGAYKDCQCREDAFVAVCQDCDGECSETIFGRARGALTHDISLFAGAVIVGEESVGAAREFGVVTGFAAAALMLI